MILSIDCGTQSIRAILFSFKGEMIDKEQIFYEPYFSKNPNWAEQKAEVYWDGLCKASNILKKRNPQGFNKIKGVSVTTLRNTMVNVDSEVNTLRPSMTWLDQRKAKSVYKPKFPLNLIFKSIGMNSTLEKMERIFH